MKKYSVALGFIMVLAVAASASAISYNDNYLVAADGGYTSPYAGAIVETFNSGSDGLTVGWELAGNWDIRYGDAPNVASAPWWTDPSANPLGAKDTTWYLTVPKDFKSEASATITFGGKPYNYLGLWWGSMDTYNTLEFLGENGQVVASYTGGTWSPGNGLQEDSRTNMYRNFYDMPNFYGVKIISTSYAFELDNLAVGYNVVPEPLSAILLGCGLLGLLGVRRKLR